MLMNVDCTIIMDHGVVIEGWTTSRRCRSCGSRGIYYLDYGAVFCPQCNDWLDRQCASPECWQGLIRPERPLAA